MTRLWVATFAAVLLSGAAARAAETSPVIEIGATLYAGDTGKSITGATGFFVGFRAEKNRGFFRPTIALKIDYATGEASIGADAPRFSLFGADFPVGFNLFFFDDGKFLPFVGASGVIGWNLLRLASPPAGVEPYTKSLAFGYEVNAGGDLRLGSLKGNAFRIRGSYWAVTSTLAGISGFQMNAFQISLGIVY